MARFEKNASEKGDLFTIQDAGAAQQAEENQPINEKGKVMDLVVPIVILIISCLIGMIYTGDFFGKAGFIEAFGNSDASVGLVLGSGVALILIVIFYSLRRVLGFKMCMGCVPEGFKAMVSPIAILTLAWSLKAMTDSLGATEFVDATVKSFAGGFMNFLPAIIFIIGCVIAFATGTSWGTFGILIPIVIAVFGEANPELMIMGISACMAGAVCGDHCSPISDTTIMSSAGAQCDHICHVNTQIPYAATVAAVSFIGYVITGLTKNIWICMPITILLLVGVMLVIRSRVGVASADSPETI
jgi:Na+/H+ antiporter NhaC